MATILTSTLRGIYQLAFECSPIVLTGGIADSVSGGVIPIISLTESSSLISTILNGTDITDLNNIMCHFKPLSGATLIDQSVGHYPFPNQTTAANATIANPLNVSMLMQCYPNGDKGVFTRFATINSLRTTLATHNASGGLYNVITPSYIYTNCLLKDIRDVSAEASPGGHVQTLWQWDFEKPLITEEDADEQSSAMSKITDGTSFSDSELSWSSIITSSGSSYSNALNSILSAFGVS